MTAGRIMPLVIIAFALVAAVAVGVKLAERAAYKDFRERAARVKATAGVYDAAPVTETDLRDVPEALARYMRLSGAVGQKPISAVHLLHSGRFKPGADKPWMPIRGEYFITTKKPSFTWYGKIGIAGVHVVAVDSYADGRGRMLVKALSVFPIVDDQSEQVAQSAFGRCVAELTMAPTFFLDRSRVRCTQTGPDQVRCTVTDGTFSTDADLFVNRDGSLDRVVVMRYFDRGGGRATLERFTGKGSLTKNFGGRVLPSKFDGIWNLADGDLHYVSFDVDRVEWE
jgi:hypothetical protein